MELFALPPLRVVKFLSPLSVIRIGYLLFDIQLDLFASVGN